MDRLTPKKKAIYIAMTCFFSHVLSLLLFWDNQQMRAACSDIFQTVIPIISCYWLFRSYLEDKRKIRKFWLLLSIPMLLFAIAQLIWDYYEILLQEKAPFPGIADIFWLMMYIFFLIAFFYPLFIYRKSIRLGQMIYDTLISTLVAATGSWEFIIKPIFKMSIYQGILYKTVMSSYIISDLGILFFVLCIFNSIRIKFVRPVFLLLSFWLVSTLSADISYLYLTSKGLYISGNLIDLLWTLGILLLGITPFFTIGDDIIIAIENTASIKKRVVTWKEYLSFYRIWVPYSGVLILFLLMILQLERLNSITVGSIVSILLIIFRHIHTLIENEAFLEESVELNKELEFKVQQRTKQLFLKNEQLSESIRKVEYLAYHDPLTELSNRRSFEKYLQQALKHAEENNEKMAVLFLDLDRYKLINDTLGHTVGDLLLQQVAKRLQTCIEDAGIISRHGGDEFLILLPNSDQEKSAAAAKGILHSLRTVFKVKDYELFITTSIGISLYPDHGKDSEVLIKKADAALYAAKKALRNQFVYYHSSMGSRNIAELDLEKYLRFALSNGELKVVYQPIIQLQTGEIKGVEALMRWENPVKGSISPEQFIPIAEENGMIIPLGIWILKTACRQWKQWVDKGINPPVVAVNISIKQFYHPNFLEQIQNVLNESGMDPAYLELEITENIFVSSNTQHVFEGLKQKGIKISIDDFGTGYSSLQYLKRLPIHKLKIDQSFIRDIPNNVNDVAIVETIIAMAHHMSLEVVAEGVETDDQLEFLQKLDCHFVQGYLFSKPLSVEKIEKKLFLANTSRALTQFL